MLFRSAGFFCVKTKVTGSIATTKENTRSTDTSAKYHVEIQAKDSGMPEGLSRVLDIMQSSIVPIEDKSSNPDAT